MELGMATKMTRMAGLLALVALLASNSSVARDSDADIGEVTFAGEQTLLQLQEKEVHARLTVDLGDGEEYVFLVDTGASVNVIDTTVAESLGYEVVGETEIGAPGGPQIPSKIVSVPTAHIGDTTISGAEFVTMDILGFSGGRMHGVIGVGLFSDYLVTFDRGAGHIKLSRAALSSEQHGVVAYDPADSQIEIGITVAGKPAVAHIDTGSMGEFMLPGDMMASLPLEKSDSTMKAKLVGGERDIQFAELQGSVEFAGMEFVKPNVAFMTPSTGSGNIGSGILSNYVVSIDQKNHLIAFQEPADGGVAAEANKPRRIGVQFKGAPGASELGIAAVGPGSIGEQAGLLANDVLLGINGNSMQHYNMHELGALFGSKETLQLEIRRDGELVSIEIP
jgi:predicted aspartyl protease